MPLDLALERHFKLPHLQRLRRQLQLPLGPGEQRAVLTSCILPATALRIRQLAIRQSGLLLLLASRAATSWITCQCVLLQPPRWPTRLQVWSKAHKKCGEQVAVFLLQPADGAFASYAGASYAGARARGKQQLCVPLPSAANALLLYRAVAPPCPPGFGGAGCAKFDGKCPAGFASDPSVATPNCNRCAVRHVDVLGGRCEQSGCWTVALSCCCH